jgi:hypothetical protein
VVIHTRYTRIQEKNLSGLKANFKAITRLNTGANLSEVIRRLNPILRGIARAPAQTVEDA